MKTKSLLGMIEYEDDTLANKIRNLYKEEVLENKEIEEKIVDVTKAIIQQQKREKINTFIKGFVMSTPYSQKEFLDEISDEIKNNPDNIRSIINDYLDQKFKESNPVFYNEIKNFEYEKSIKNVVIKTPKDKKELQTHIQLTASCIKSRPSEFFEETLNDPGTIYLLAKSNGVLSYIRCFIYQNKEKEKNFVIDNLSSNKKEYLFYELIKSAANISEELGFDLLDRTSTSILKYNSFKREFVNLEDSYYKTGFIPLKQASITVKLNDKSMYTKFN